MDRGPFKRTSFTSNQSYFYFSGRQRKPRSGRETLHEEESSAHPMETPAGATDEPTYCICKEVIRDNLFKFKPNFLTGSYF